MSLHSTPDFRRLSRRYSPVGVLVITIIGIALAETLVMIAVYFVRDWPYPLQVLLDAILIAAIIFPLLYLLSFKPLLLITHQQRQSESIAQSRLRVMQFANTSTLDELLQFILDEIESLTGAMIGFFHFLEDDQKTIRLQAWSTNTLQNMCQAQGKGAHYDLEQAGVWADAVRQRRPIIHNDYASLPHRKGMPDGHAQVVREIVVPIMRDNKVVATLGVGNKPRDFTANDVELASTFADFAWDIVEHKRDEITLRQNEQKFRTLIDWTYDWEKWLDPDGNIVYSSPSCEPITGHTPAEFIADPDLLVRIVHPDDRQAYIEHLNATHDASAGPASFEYRIISRDGSEHWIEHVCRPLFDLDNHHLGRRVSNREATARKKAEQKIIEQAQHEAILAQTIRTIQADIARDLHDTLGQNIGFLRMNLEYLSANLWTDLNNVKTQIQNMSNTANESYELVRSMLAMLQSGVPSDPLRLFSRYAEQIAGRTSIGISITSQGAVHQLSLYQIRQLFYIFREALSNVEKYASASQVSGVFHWQERNLTFEISDNGCGFDPQTVQPTGHYGLKFMVERAEILRGSLSIHSAPGQGTVITINIPYEHESVTLLQ